MYSVTEMPLLTMSRISSFVFYTCHNFENNHKPAFHLGQLIHISNIKASIFINFNHSVYWNTEI